MSDLDAVSNKIPKEISLLYGFIVLKENKNKLLIGISDPGNKQIIKNNIKKYYDIEDENIDYKILNEKELASYIENELQDDNKKEKSIIELCDEMFEKSIKLNSTDIHIEPYEDGLLVRFRILGELKILDKIPSEKKDEFIARLKIISKLDVSEKRRPQDGRINLEIENKMIDVRISILPLLKGEKIVLRILNKDNFTFKIEDLDLGENELNLINRIIQRRNGLLLIAGPAGSGKTTTIYTLLNKLKTEKNNIMTIEDPVEYRFEGINQSQTNLSVGYTFESGLNSILRQDPDIILVGELREEQTANLAIRAAETGHLVLSSIHTNDCSSAIFRLLGMNIEKHLLISALTGIISQRLVKILCDKCKVRTELSNEDKIKLNLKKDFDVYEACGCSECMGGYTKRKAILEIVLMDENNRRLLEKNPFIDDIREEFKKNGVKRLFDSGLELLIEGSISLEEAYKLIN